MAATGFNRGALYVTYASFAFSVLIVLDAKFQDSGEENIFRFLLGFLHLIDGIIEKADMITRLLFFVFLQVSFAFAFSSIIINCAKDSFRDWIGSAFVVSAISAWQSLMFVVFIVVRGNWGGVDQVLIFVGSVILCLWLEISMLKAHYFETCLSGRSKGRSKTITVEQDYRDGFRPLYLSAGSVIFCFMLMGLGAFSESNIQQRTVTEIAVVIGGLLVASVIAVVALHVSTQSHAKRLGLMPQASDDLPEDGSAGGSEEVSAPPKDPGGSGEPTLGAGSSIPANAAASQQHQ